MSRLRCGLLVAVLLACALCPSVSAAPPGCPLIVDQARDTAAVWDPSVEKDMPELDLRSIDMVSDRSTMTAVLRVTRLAPTMQAAPTGARWGVTFKVSGGTTWLYLWAISDPAGALHYEARYTHPAAGVGLSLGAVDGRFDTARNEIRITAPLKVFADVSPLAPGTWVADIQGLTGVNIAAQRLGYRLSDASRTGVHRIAGRSCVR